MSSRIYQGTQRVPNGTKKAKDTVWYKVDKRPLTFQGIQRVLSGPRSPKGN